MTKRPKHVHSKHESKKQSKQCYGSRRSKRVYKFNPLSNADTTRTYIYFNQQMTNILLRE